MIEIRDYTKTELRAILSNPSVDTTNPNFAAICRLKGRREFYNEVYPIVEMYCKNLMPLVDFKRKKIIPHKVVNIIFQYTINR